MIRLEELTQPWEGGSSGGQHSCRWSLFLLSGLLKLFGIAEALTVTEVTSDVSSPPVIETKVISRTGENVTLYCRADFPISDLSVSWYHLGEDGSHAKVRSYSPHDDHIQEHPEFRGRTLLIIRPGEVLLTLWIVRPQDSGTYICVQENNHQSTERYMILQVTGKLAMISFVLYPEKPSSAPFSETFKISPLP